MLDRPAGWSPAPPGLLPGTGPAPSSVFLTARLPGSRGAGGEGGGLVTLRPTPRNGRDSHPRPWAWTWARWGGGLLPLHAWRSSAAAVPAQPGAQQAAWASARPVPGAVGNGRLPPGRGAPGPGTHGGLMGSSLSRAQERAGWTGEHPRGRHPMSPGGAVGGAGAGGRGSE